MAQLERINPDWRGELCIVAAPGPSLTPEVAEACRGHRVIAVQDSYRLMPWADALYGCDNRWWDIHKDCAGFAGEKWTTHEGISNPADADVHEGHDKLRRIADAYGLRVVKGAHGSEFSLSPDTIMYGANAGFQAINLAILKGCRRIVLVGYDMRTVNGQRHFFGNHPRGLQNSCTFEDFIPHFAHAAKRMPKEILIINATPGSALDCFKRMPLEDALADDSLLWHRPVDQPAASAGGAG